MSIAPDSIRLVYHCVPLGMNDTTESIASICNSAASAGWKLETSCMIGLIFSYVPEEKYLIGQVPGSPHKRRIWDVGPTFIMDVHKDHVKQKIKELIDGVSDEDKGNQETS